LYKWKCFSRSQTPPYILTKRKLIKKLPKTYPPHGSPNNQKETKSHGSPCDFTINHKETISHGAHDISQCTMTKLWNPTTQLTPLNNYLSNCVITSSYTSSYRCNKQMNIILRNPTGWPFVETMHWYWPNSNDIKLESSKANNLL